RARWASRSGGTSHWTTTRGGGGSSRSARGDPDATTSSSRRRSKTWPATTSASPSTSTSPKALGYKRPRPSLACRSTCGDVPLGALTPSSLCRHNPAMKVGGRDVPPPAAALLLLSLLAGCRQNPDETAQKSRETIDSWSSTVTMAGRQWVGGRVPDLFLRQVLR